MAPKSPRNNPDTWASEHPLFEHCQTKGACCRQGQLAVVAADTADMDMWKQPAPSACCVEFLSIWIDRSAAKRQICRRPELAQRLVNLSSFPEGRVLHVFLCVAHGWHTSAATLNPRNSSSAARTAHLRSSAETMQLRKAPRPASRHNHRHSTARRSCCRR